MSDPSTDSSPRFSLTGLGWFLAIAVLLGCVLRVWGCFATDFWLDEIWGLTLALRVSSPLDVFTKIHFDTNHWLYTFYLHACGRQTHWSVYRIPALIAGLLTIPLMGKIAGRLALLLAAMSSLLAIYSSEARGYAFLVLFSLTAFYALRHYINQPQSRWVWLFVVASVLGFTSHPTFSFTYSGFVAWSALAQYRRGTTWSRRLIALINLHLIPSIWFLTLYFVDIRFIQHGGADPHAVKDVLLHFIGQTLGLSCIGWLAALLGVGLVASECVQLWKRRDDEWSFYLVLLFLAPTLVIVSTARDFSYWTERHFIVCIPFILLLLARCMVRLPRVVGFLILAAYLAGNGLELGRFVAYGRGHYLDAIKQMAQQTPGHTVTMGSDHDFRNSAMLAFYAPYVPEKEFVYYKDHEWPSQGPDWFIAHRTDLNFRPPVSVTFDQTSYRLSAEFPYSGISGWTWFLYKKIDPPQ